MGIGAKSIWVVGVGPGGRDLITPEASNRVHRAAMLVGADRLLALFPDFQGPTVSLSKGIADALDTVETSTQTPVAVLVSGDAGLMSLSSKVIERFGRDACEVIPGISAVQVAFARMGRSWHRAPIVDAHGRVPDIAPAELADADDIAVLTGCPAAEQWLHRLTEQLIETHEIIALQDLTLDTEQIRTVPRQALRSLASAPRTIVLFLKKEVP